jgi:hypothetical protein
MTRLATIFILGAFILCSSIGYAFTGTCTFESYAFVAAYNITSPIVITGFQSQCGTLGSINYGPSLLPQASLISSTESFASGECSGLGGTLTWNTDWQGGTVNSNGYFTYTRPYTCTVSPKSDCSYTTSSGITHTVVDGYSRVFYRTDVVQAPNQCEFIEKQCSDGLWTSSQPNPHLYTHTQCSLQVPCNCTTFQSQSFAVTACIDKCGYASSDVLFSKVGVSYNIQSSQSMSQPQVRWKPYNSASYNSLQLLFQSLIGLTPATTFYAPDVASFDISYCGDGIVQSPEQCDDPTSSTCSIDCKTVASQPWCDSQIATLTEIWQAKTGTVIPQLKAPNIAGQARSWCTLLGYNYTVAVDGTVLDSCTAQTNFKRLDGYSTLVDVNPCTGSIGPEYITAVKCQNYQVGSCKERPSDCAQNPLMCVTPASANCKQLGTMGCDVFDLSYKQKWYAFNCSMSTCGDTQRRIITGGHAWG